MIVKSFNLVLSILIATSLVILQETMSNLFWLISVDMPISIGIFFLTFSKFCSISASNILSAVSDVFCLDFFNRSLIDVIINFKT